MRLKGKVALITGAASGIGEATLRRFLAEGAMVAGGDLRLIDPLGPNHLPLRLDVTSEVEWQAAVAAVESRFGALHVLVNNAGIAHPAPVDAISLDDWRRVMAVTLDGTFLGIRHAVPALRRAGGGAVVNVSSMMGSIAARNAPAYAAAKAGVLGLTRAAALDLAPEIRVSALQPGYVDTPLLSARLDADPERRGALLEATPLGRLATVDDVAAALVWMASDEACYLTGTGVMLDGGYTVQ